MVRKILPAALPAILVAALAVAPAQAREPGIAAITPCTNGMAAGYPCKNVDLWSNLPRSSMGGGSGSGGWGWHDASTNREYAIVARNSGTSFVDVTARSRFATRGTSPISATPAARTSSA